MLLLVSDAVSVFLLQFNSLHRSIVLSYFVIICVFKVLPMSLSR